MTVTYEWSVNREVENCKGKSYQVHSPGKAGMRKGWRASEQQELLVAAEWHE